jgi:hypothetical protein
MSQEQSENKAASGLGSSLAPKK